MSTNIFNAGNVTTDTASEVKSGFAVCPVNTFDTIKSDDATQIQVGGGNTLYFGRVLFKTGAASGCIRIGYGDTAVSASASPPTNAVFVTPLICNPVASDSREYRITAVIPAGKFPFIKADNTGSADVHVDGIEI